MLVRKISIKNMKEGNFLNKKYTIIYVICMCKIVRRNCQLIILRKIVTAVVSSDSYWLCTWQLKIVLSDLLCLISKSCLTLLRRHRLALHAPVSMGFSMQEYSSGLPFPSPEDLPDPGIEPMSPAWQAYYLPLSYQGSALYN